MPRVQTINVASLRLSLWCCVRVGGAALSADRPESAPHTAFPAGPGTALLTPSGCSDVRDRRRETQSPQGLSCGQGGALACLFPQPTLSISLQWRVHSCAWACVCARRTRAWTGRGCPGSGIPEKPPGRAAGTPGKNWGWRWGQRVSPACLLVGAPAQTHLPSGCGQAPW